MHKVHTRIPKLHNKQKIRSKTCSTHHSILCKTCFLIKQACKTLHKCKNSVSLDTDLKFLGRDPTLPGGNLLVSVPDPVSSLPEQDPKIPVYDPSESGSNPSPSGLDLICINYSSESVSPGIDLSRHYSDTCRHRQNLWKCLTCGCCTCHHDLKAYRQKTSQVNKSSTEQSSYRRQEPFPRFNPQQQYKPYRSKIKPRVTPLLWMGRPVCGMMKLQYHQTGTL